MPNIITPARNDAATFQLVLTHDAVVTPAVVNALWHWFNDVELALPLPVMELTDAQRKTLALTILDDLDEEFAALEAACEGKPMEAQSAIVAAREDKINSLWRELAGCYATVLNAEVHVVPEEVRAEVQANVLHDLLQMTGLDEDGVRDLLNHDPRLRMMLRKSGINPDDLF